MKRRVTFVAGMAIWSTLIASIPAVAISIDPKHAKCKATSDCAIIYTSCSSGRGAEAVAKTYEKQYQQLIDKECKKYKGPVESVAEGGIYVSCQKGRCEIMLEDDFEIPLKPIL